MSFVDIESRVGDATLRIEPVLDPDDPEHTAWSLRLTGRGPLEAQILARDDLEDESKGLIEFFAEIHDDQRGWDGEKHWQSRLGALTIMAEHDNINTVRLHVQMSGGAIPQWLVKSIVLVDPGRFHRAGANLELYCQALLGETGEDGPGRVSPHDAAAIRAAHKQHY